MKTIRRIGSLAFVLGLFTVVFAGAPWHVMVADDPVVPWWLRIAVFCLLGGILLVLLTLAIEQKLARHPAQASPPADEPDRDILLLNSAAVGGRDVTETPCAVVTVFVATITPHWNTMAGQASHAPRRGR